MLDFGLARITDSDIAASTVLTDLGDVQGTIPYMSPEQVQGNTDEIDLRTDIYSLGIVLYELLSGRLPYDIAHSSLTEMARIITQVPPAPLATAWRGARPLDPDLATIAHKALEKEPARRYQSAAAMADDIQRYLTGQAILARPPSVVYQLRKLIGRHRVPFAFAAALVLLLAGIAVTMTAQAGRIARERDRANREAATAHEVSDFLVTLFRTSDPGAARGNSVTARELLDRGAERITRELAGQPLLQARLMQTIGGVYAGLGLFNQAGPLVEHAYAVRTRYLAGDDPGVVESLGSMASVYLEQGKLEDAQRIDERILAIQEKRFGPNSLEAAGALGALCGPLRLQHKYDQARDAFTRAIAIFETDRPPSRGLAYCLNDFGVMLQDQGDDAAALPYYERALEIKKQFCDPASPDLNFSTANIAMTLVRLGNYDRAQPILEATCVSFEKIYGPAHPLTATAWQNLGEMWQRRGDPVRARPWLERAIASQDQLGRWTEMAYSEQLLANGMRDQRQFAPAESLYHSALTHYEQVLGPENTALCATLEDLARLLRTANRAAEAEAVAARAAKIRAQTGRP